MRSTGCFWVSARWRFLLLALEQFCNAGAQDAEEAWLVTGKLEECAERTEAQCNLSSCPATHLLIVL